MTERVPASPGSPAPRVSADEIADAIGAPRPTSQQRAVIESPLEPALVIAGAGSGKTATMANRVLWLLANGYVSMNEILGLTFTRKAARELASRIRTRIGELHAKGLLPGEYDEFDPPLVATYNSFSNTIYRDNAILLGRESDGAVLGEASAWQLARSIVVQASDARLSALDKNVDAVTKAVIALSHALSENVADPERVRDMAEEFARLAELPTGGRGEYNDVLTLINTVGSLPLLIELAQRFAHEKMQRGFIEYSDQVALALELVRTVPRIAEEFRERFAVVLLDEYQDTSVVQTWLLSEMFAKHPVMAVGDPNQSIYGWRGASAANLEDFARQFAGGDVRSFALATSWRNGHDILSVANALVQPLAGVSRVGVQRLDPAPAATARPVDVIYEETLVEEAEATALWMKDHLEHGVAAASADADTHERRPSAAILFRARKTQGVFIDALRKHGVPFHVLGVGGLMAEPEIADLVCALSVVDDPTAGPQLVRLLAGSRWRIGVKDLHALSRLASWLRDRDVAQKPLDDVVKQTMRESVADEEGGSIVDALDFLATAREGHTALSGFSEVGLSRLREAAKLFARLRARLGLDLLDFVTLVQQELLLDIEVGANDMRAGGPANMEAFFDALSSYLVVDDSASLRGFLGWLREAEWRDGLAPRPEEPEPGTVQLLTIHGAKGLEWDAVAVPRMVDKELPASPRDGLNGWLTFGSLPYEFRGDADELPHLEWRSVSTRKQLSDARKEFRRAVELRHTLEERRLAYVAVTRARHALLLSGSFWATQTMPRRPSPFLVELSESGVIAELPSGSEYEVNPLGDDAQQFLWPMDPLGSRRAAVESAAEQVRAALGALDSDAREQSSRRSHTGEWSTSLELLLEERRARLNASGLVALPARVPASRFKDYVTDPASVAASLRRPMPEKPYRATRLGTLFHSWVEERYGIGGSAESIDALETELDDILGTDAAPIEQAQLAALRETFERSEFAALKPVEVEIEIHLLLDSEIIVCKLDAVYFTEGRYRIVDWKTGKAPRDAADLEAKQFQLALYRQAFAEWKGVDPDQIDAVFYFVSDDRIIRPERIYSKDELVELWRAVTASSD